MTDTNQQLRDHVRSIADAITDASYDFDPEYSDYDEPCAADYLADALDIEYIISSAGEYLGARVLVTFGGPNIWINTRTGTVEGAWWMDRFNASFTDGLGLDDFLSELCPVVAQ
jgi:hypothetical protein